MSRLGEEEKRDRQMLELLNETRVAMPGVQILFAFLLVVPFSARFDAVTAFQRNVFFATLLLVTLSTACLIAPTAAHRLLFHRGQREWIVEGGNRLLIAALAFLALALVGAVVLVTDFLYDGAVVVLVPAAIAVVLFGLWFAGPIARRRAS